ncbi:hypothetical protein D623_10029917 [Myotis brandtii]|uniref:Uncharacterized protein n=1 Tax=Myotis brandtii TaxID=109478 RepID=S7PD01_MYOBR|nr:hypothetical protein D623_10029917 [Myotis brandtii]
MVATRSPADTTAGDRLRHPPDRRSKERNRLARPTAAQGSQRPAATKSGNLPGAPVLTPPVNKASVTAGQGSASRPEVTASNL